MKTRALHRPLLSAFAALLLFLAVGISLVFYYVNLEKQRDLQGWQIRIGNVAETQLQSVDKWLDTQFLVLQGLADNASLRFYLMQLAAIPGSETGSAEAAQIAYARNLLVATADRDGFLDKGALNTLVRADLPSVTDQGMAIFSPSGVVLAATPGFETDAEIAELVRATGRSGGKRIRDLTLNRRGEPVVGFMVAVAPLNAQAKDTPSVGVVIGIKRARDELYPLLIRNLTGLREETVIVRLEGTNSVNLSPLADGTPTLKQRLLATTPHLATAFALKSPGTFAADLQDPQGRPVLMSSRAFKQTPWVLVHTVDANVAMKESSSHQSFLLTTLLLATLAATLAQVAAWRHGSAARAKQLATVLRSQSKQLAQQASLLQSITDHTQEFIFILDNTGHFVFANPSLARAICMAPEDLPGKTLSSVLGANTANTIETLLQIAQDAGSPSSSVQTLEIGEVCGTFHSTAASFKDEDEHERVLLVARDITAIQQEQQRQDALLRQLVRTLMRAVDKHDPYCANHSGRTAQVALAIGKAMGLNQADINTLEMAGQLANVGKLYVPKSILTKTESLTDDEQGALQLHVQYTLDILSGLEFEGRVLDTIAQKHEYLDGSGYPKGLREPDMLQTGKILAVANSFVAMISARAYRPGLSLEQALDSLLRDAKTRYDRHVVAALFHVAENRSDWMDWSNPPTT